MNVDSILGKLNSFSFSPEEENMRLREVHAVVDPPDALLHPEVPPLGLRHEVIPRHQLRQLLRQDDVTVLEVLVLVLVRVVDLVLDVLVGHDSARI